MRRNPDTVSRYVREYEATVGAVSYVLSKKEGNFDMKRKISFILALSMILTTVSTSSVFAAKNSSDNFVKSRKYENQFTDVNSSDWYADSVSNAYEYGLVSGNSATSYNPSGNVSIAETIVIACRLNNIYCEKNEKFEGGEIWYQPYVDYALENKIIDKEYTNYNIPATRREFARILSSSLPSEAFTAINKITEIPDVTSDEDNIYMLYNAGIVAGSDKYGTFNPTSNIQRSEVAAIIVRIADKTQRKKVVLEKKPVEVESVTLDKNSISMTAGEKESLEATILPNNATDKSITYTSSDSSVATISAVGEITALKEGSTTITVTTNNGKTASCRIEVKKKTPINTTVYEDSKVKITFLRVEKYKYGDDRVSVYCDVENKTNETITIQCDALSLNGYSFNNVIMSDDVSANCIGTVDTTLSNFNFSLVDINNITSFGGQYRIISDDKTFKTYTATFINQNLFENKKEKNYPKVSGKELLYSDNKINIYFDYAENDDEDLEVYLTVQNKTDETILIQNDTVVINKRSYDNTIMSDEVLPYTTGNVNVTVRDAAMGSVSTIGGDFRIISDDKTFKTYTATLGKTSSKDDDDEYNSESSTSSASTSSTYQVYAGTKVPTFTGVTGIPLKATDNTSTQKIYRYQGLEKITDYMDFLTANGWTFYYKDVDEVKRISHFCYKKNGEIVVISLVNLFTENETWISVDK